MNKILLYFKKVMLKKLRNKKYFVVISGITLALLLGAGIFYFNPHAKFAIVQITEKVPFIDIGSVEPACKIEDLDKNTLKAGDAVKISCSVLNNTKQDIKDAVLYTGIAKNKVNYIRELKNISALEVSNNEILLKNVNIVSKSKTDLSFLANTNFSDKSYEIVVHGVLKTNGQELKSTEESKLSVASNTLGQTQVMIQTKRKE